MFFSVNFCMLKGLNKMIETWYTWRTVISKKVQLKQPPQLDQQ